MGGTEKKEEFVFTLLAVVCALLARKKNFMMQITNRLIQYFTPVFLRVCINMYAKHILLFRLLSQHQINYLLYYYYLLNYYIIIIL